MNKIWKFIKKNYILVFSIAYFIWPLDIIPEVAVLVGGPFVLVDDVFLLFLGVAQLIYNIIKNNRTVQKDIQMIDEEGKEVMDGEELV